MTEPQDTHVAVDDLAAYAAGELDGASAVSVEAHVLLCPECRTDLDALTATLADLREYGDEPAPPMPADVAERIEAAIVAERAAPTPGATVLPLRRRRVNLAGLSAVAAGVALVAAVGVGLRATGDDRGGSAAGEAGSRRDGTVTVTSGVDYTDATLAAAVPQLLSAPQQFSASSKDSKVRTASGDTAATPPVETSRQPDAAAPMPVTEGYAFQGTSDTLAGCVRALSADGPVLAPLLVDHARYEGAPAVIVILPTVRNGQPQDRQVDVWVVEPTCSAADAKVLSFQRVRI